MIVNRNDEIMFIAKLKLKVHKLLKDFFFYLSDKNSSLSQYNNFEIEIVLYVLSYNTRRK